MIEVRLYGHLRARFGRGHRLDVSSPAEAVRALCAVVPGFKPHLLEHSEPGYRVTVSRVPVDSEEQLHHPVGGIIGIVPVVAGRAGAGKILAGIALIVVSFFVPAAWGFAIGALQVSVSALAFNIGVSLVIGGVTQMLAGSPKAPTPSEQASNQPSYNFNGAVNVTGQGHPVPVCYGGPIRVGSQVISTGLSTAKLSS